jgi:hypothetical protein
MPASRTVTTMAAGGARSRTVELKKTRWRPGRQRGTRARSRTIQKARLRCSGRRTLGEGIDGRIGDFFRDERRSERTVPFVVATASAIGAIVIQRPLVGTRPGLAARRLAMSRPVGRLGARLRVLRNIRACVEAPFELCSGTVSPGGHAKEGSATSVQCEASGYPFRKPAVCRSVRSTARRFYWSHSE